MRKSRTPLSETAAAGLPDSTRTCTPTLCGRVPKVYVAISTDLCERGASQAGAAAGLGPYVFKKVGSALGMACSRRDGELNIERSYRRSGKGSPRPHYAGMRNWVVLKCWHVEVAQYDDREFFRWLAGVDGVRRISGYRFETTATRSGFHDAWDLCLMSQEFLASGTTGKPPHPRHDEMLAFVRSTMIACVQPFLRSLDGR